MQSVKLSHIRKWRQQPIRVRNPLGRIQLRPDGQRSRSLGLNPCQELLYVKVKFVFTLLVLPTELMEGWLSNSQRTMIQLRGLPLV